MKVNDIVFWQDDEFGRHRFWKIEAVCLGADGHESLVRLRSLTERPGLDDDGVRHETTVVPEPLLRFLTIYTPDTPPSEDKP